MITYIHDVEFRRAIVNPVSLLSIMHLPTLEVMGIPRDRTVKQPVEVSGFRGNNSFTLDFINLDMTNSK